MTSTLRPVRPPRHARPSRRGVAGHGGGAVAYVPVPIAYQATTNQLAGMWPFAAPGALPRVGTPIGRHLTSGEVVCFDHIGWFEQGLIGNPSVYIIAKPGLGKSTLASQMMLGLSAQGYVLLIPGDTKPDYVRLVDKLGGEVRKVRRTGGAAFNPCDPGGMVTAGRRIADVPGMEVEGIAVTGEAIARATTLIGGLLELSRKGPVADYEESVISASLTVLYEQLPAAPVLGQLVDYITGRPQDLREVLITGADHDAYDRLALPLLRSLKALVGGKYGDTFARPTVRTATPVALDIDTSAIKAGDPAFLGAVLMAAWADVYGMVEAEQALADAGLMRRRLYCLTLDELWRVLNLGGTLAERVNELTRLNRTQGVGQIMITHSIRDDPTGGLAERAGAIVIGGVPHKEITALADVLTLTGAEQQSLAEWWSTSQGKLAGGDLPPGAGLFLIKPSADDPGIPTRVILPTPVVEWGGQNTNEKWARGQGVGK